MQKIFLVFLIPVLIISAFTACNDPVFFTISTEVPVVPALIDGSPTNFVELDNRVYVASGESIFRYNGEWTRDNDLIIPGGKIMSLAATNTALYALCLNGSTTRLKETKNAQSAKPEWKDTGGTGLNIQAVFAVGNELIISSVSANYESYAVHRINTLNNAVTQITGMESVSEFRGAAFNGTTYYLCTNDGIYTSDLVTASMISGSTGKSFMGIINLGSDIAAIARNGDLYSVNDLSKAKVSFPNTRRLATGALALWSRDGVNLLLVGAMDSYYSTNSGYEYGYMEIELAGGSINPNKGYERPGLNPSLSTVDNPERFTNTIGKTPVNHIYQPSPSLNLGGTLIFASTNSGVWSYRERNDEWQWNAEE